MSNTQPQKMKVVHALNDYLVVLIKSASSTILMPEEKLEPEGMIIGVGPDVNKGPHHNYIGTDDEIKVGDEVVFRSVKYTALKPRAGVYEGRTIFLMHKPDLILRHSKLDPTKYDFVDEWTKDDHDTTRDSYIKSDADKVLPGKH